MKKAVIASAMVATLSGCMQLADVESAPVSANVAASFPKDRLAKNTNEITVRAFLPGEKPNTLGQEVIGAKCTLKSDELTATVITPQKVIVPGFKQAKAYPNRGVPGSLVVRCSTGKAKGQSVLTVSGKSAATTTGAGAGAAILTTLITAAVASSTPWYYPPQAFVVVSE